jgi:hypothetical protein
MSWSFDKVQSDRLLAVVAAGSTNPPGVVAILNFARGRGAFKPDLVHSPDRLVDAFGALGRTARSTALWLFAENDHSFGPALAGRMFDAYTASGAPAQLKMLPPFGAMGTCCCRMGLLTCGGHRSKRFSLHCICPPHWGSKYGLHLRCRPHRWSVPVRASSAIMSPRALTPRRSLSTLTATAASTSRPRPSMRQRMRP